MRPLRPVGKKTEKSFPSLFVAVSGAVILKFCFLCNNPFTATMCRFLGFSDLWRGEEGFVLMMQY